MYLFNLAFHVENSQRRKPYYVICCTVVYFQNSRKTNGIFSIIKKCKWYVFSFKSTTMLDLDEILKLYLFQ